MKKATVCFATAYIFLSVNLCLAQESADVILYNGKVLTVDDNFTIAEGIAVRDNKIAAVGKNDEILRLAGSETLRIDLKGKTVVPGLIHTHTHVHAAAEANYGRELTPAQQHQYPINWRIVRSKDDVLKQIKDIMNAFKFKPGEWILFSSENRGGDSVLPAVRIEQGKIMWEELNRWDLDKVTPDNPVVVSLSVPIGAAAMYNSKAIELMWEKYGDFIETYGRYWIDDSGRPDGHMEPPANRLVFEFLSYPTPEELAPLYRKTLEENAARGTTTLSTRLPDYSIAAYQLLSSRGELPVRVAYGSQSDFGVPDRSIERIEVGAGSDMVWVISVTPAGVDGSGARMCIDIERNSLAASEDPGMMGLTQLAELFPRGQCRLDIEFKGGGWAAPIKANYYKEWFGEVAQNNLRLGNVHVSGDGAHSRLLTFLEEIDRAMPGAVKGWGMDHCTLIDPQDISRAAKLGLMWSCDLDRLEGASGMAKAFGQDVAHTFIAPIKSMLDAGINVSLEGVWEDIEFLIRRTDSDGRVWGAAERVDRVTALRVATRGGANYVLRGDELGSLEPGKLADLVVIDGDYMTIPEEEISEILALLTMVGGRMVFLHTQFAQEYNLNTEGAVIGTYQDLVKRRKRYGNSRS